MKKILFLFLFLMLFSFVLADSPEESVEKYYSSATAENLADYFSVTDLTGLTEEDVALEKRIVELTWNVIDEQTYSISEKKAVIDSAGKDALVQFKLSASYKNTNTGEKTSFTDMAYIALLTKQENWKVVYSIPIKEYLELREKTLEIKAIEFEAEEMIKDNPKEEGKVLIDGKPWGGKGTEGGSLLGLIDSAILVVEIIIGILVLLLIISFFTGGKKEKKIGGGEQKVIINVQTPTQKPTTKTTEQPKSTQTKKEYSDSMKILRKRYASGEITKEEFSQMKKDLGN